MILLNLHFSDFDSNKKKQTVDPNYKNNHDLFINPQMTCYFRLCIYTSSTSLSRSTWTHNQAVTKHYIMFLASFSLVYILMTVDNKIKSPHI